MGALGELHGDGQSVQLVNQGNFGFLGSSVNPSVDAQAIDQQVAPSAEFDSGHAFNQ